MGVGHDALRGIVPDAVGPDPLQLRGVDAAVEAEALERQRLPALDERRRLVAVDAVDRRDDHALAQEIEQRALQRRQVALLEAAAARRRGGGAGRRGVRPGQRPGADVLAVREEGQAQGLQVDRQPVRLDLAAAGGDAAAAAGHGGAGGDVDLDLAGADGPGGALQHDVPLAVQGVVVVAVEQVRAADLQQLLGAQLRGPGGPQQRRQQPSPSHGKRSLKIRPLRSPHQ